MKENLNRCGFAPFIFLFYFEKQLICKRFLIVNKKNSVNVLQFTSRYYKNIYGLWYNTKSCTTNVYLYRKVKVLVRSGNFYVETS